MIENAMDQVEGKNSKEVAAKREMVLRRWLSDDEDTVVQGQFADPAMFFK